MRYRLHWPPRPLGLGTPFNSALATREMRAAFIRASWQYVLLGIATVLVIGALDQLLFAGVSVQRIRTVGAQPFGVRCIIVLYSAVTEELIFRLLIATLIAWLMVRALARFGRLANPIAVWSGILGAAVLFGLAHVPNLAHVPHPYLRAITLNGVAGIVLGWLYWRRGLEAAILAHLAADAIAYLAIASFL
jgi:membrane protease YdiL (CAAX protease family)